MLVSRITSVDFTCFEFSEDTKTVNIFQSYQLIKLKRLLCYKKDLNDSLFEIFVHTLPIQMTIHY